MKKKYSGALYCGLHFGWGTCIDFRMKKAIMCLLAGMCCGCSFIPVEEPSLTAKIGQILMVGFRGETVDESSPVLRDIRELNLGGVILFDVDVALGESRRNIRSPEQLAQLTSTLQSSATTPLLIAIDQEGGRVNRLKPEYGFPSTSSHQELGEKNDPAFTYQETRQLAEALHSAGINLNLAPVVDLSVRPDNFIVKKERTFSAASDAVIHHAARFMQAHHDKGIFCVLKHFPGHGSSMTDSHLGLADVTATWSRRELEPYRALCKTADVVMTAHVFHRGFDPDWPATLSEKIITGVLRNQLGYDGVVMSDDLGMKAIADHYGFETALERALNAGVDLILVANNTDYDPDIVPVTIRIIIGLVESGGVSEDRIDEAFRRVSRLKSQLLP